MLFGHNCLGTTRNRLVSKNDQINNLFMTIKKLHYQYNGDDCLNFGRKFQEVPNSMFLGHNLLSTPSPRLFSTYNRVFVMVKKYLQRSLRVHAHNMVNGNLQFLEMKVEILALFDNCRICWPTVVLRLRQLSSYNCSCK